MLDLMIKNGTIVNHHSSVKADIGIKDGKIVVIGDAKALPKAHKVIDATNKYVIPGMIDSHAHVFQSQGEHDAIDSFYIASKAAAYGGTTTMIDFAIPHSEETPLQAINRKKETAKNDSLINYSFHACYTNRDVNSFGDIGDIITDGIPTLKMFTVYEDAVMIDTGKIYEILKIIRKNGGMAKFHAENEEMIQFKAASYIANNQTTAYYHALSRPAITEYVAIASLLPLIKKTEVPSIFLHVSNDHIRRIVGNEKDTLPVFFEACPHYLTLTEEVYKQSNGHNYACCPPIRSKEIQESLWDFIEDGLIDVVNSDHSDFNLSQKEKNKNDFTRIPNGLPGIETRGTILFSEGVHKRKLSINKFVDLTSTKNAKLMGMYPRKGVIEIDSDADIVIFDPNQTYEITTDNLHMATDYTPFEGMEITGIPTHTIINGEVIIANGKLVNDQYRGNLIKRGSPIID